MRICFITSLFGNNYNTGDKPGIFKKNTQYDYFLFTNFSPDIFNTSWNVINISDKLSHISSNIIKSRYPKFMGWKLLEDILQKDYDIVIYCDAGYYPKPNIDWNEFAKETLNHPSQLMQQVHEERDAYQELMILDKQLKDNKERSNKTHAYLKEHHFPKKSLMTENTIFMYNPKNKDLQKIFQDFWNIYSPYTLSHRDQPLWSFILWKHQFIPLLKKLGNWKGSAYFEKPASWKGNHTYV